MLLTDKQTDRQTDKQANAGKNIIPSAELVTVRQTTGIDSKQIHLVDHRASEALRLTSPEEKSLAQGTIISKIHS